MTLLDHALGYIRAGLPVIPVAKTKKPWIPWEAYQKRLPTEDEIREWWAKWPDAGIALITGKLSGLIVVDTEKGADLDLFGLKDSETPTSQSGGGGLHFFFAYEPLSNSVRFADLYDIRGDGGYIIVPPSSHQSGGSYEWLIPLGAVEPQPFPESIKAKLNAKHSHADAITSIVGEGSRNQTATSVTGTLLARFSPTEWESKAWPLLRGWNYSHSKPPLANAELRSIFDSITKSEVNKRKMTSEGVAHFSDDDLRSNIEEIEDNGLLVSIPTNEGIARFVFREIEQSSNHDIDTLLSVEFHIPGSAPKPFTARVNIISLTTRSTFARELQALGKGIEWRLLMNTACETAIKYLAERDTSIDLSTIPDAQTQTLFYPFLYKGTANLLFGDGGTGKTYMGLRMALSLVFGIEFLGYKPQEQTNVLFIDYEDTEQTASFRISQLCQKMGLDAEQAKKRVRYFNPGGKPLYTVIPALKKVIREHDIGFALVDSVASACGNEPERAESAVKYYNALHVLGVTSLSIAHIAKSTAGQGGNQDYAFGSIFWHNLARNTWNVQGEEETAQDELASIAGDSAKQLGLFHRKCNNGKRHRPIPLRVVYSPDGVRFESGNLGFWESKLPVGDRILRLLRSQNLTRTEIDTALDDIEKNTIKVALRRLKDQNLIWLDGGQNGVWRRGKQNTAVPHIQPEVQKGTSSEVRTPYTDI
jgi:hypothetical protein